MRITFVSGFVLLGWVLALATGDVQGQAAQGVRRVIDVEQVKRDMKTIGLAYHAYHDAMNGKAPKKAADLAPYYEKNTRLTELLEKGTYVFHYNLTLRQMTNGSSNTILCYEKDVDETNQRVVALGDGSVQVLPTDEFKKIMKAQGK